jgi:glycosyltransferase involved in cell wall biosynthesis
MQIELTIRSGGKRLKGLTSESRADQPLVTVITAVFNGQPYVAQCLESVLRQDYPNIEHIVLDGGSSDGTVGVLRQYDDRIALWRSEHDRGIYDAWNKALLEARGDWICFLGADDEFFPGAVSAYMALAAKNPQAEYLSSEARLVFPSGKEITIGRPWAWKEFSRRMQTCHVGSMHRRSLFERHGHFDTSYRISGDYEFLLRSRSELRSAFLPAETVMLRSGGASYSSAVFYESNRARHETGGVPKSLALIDLSLELIHCKARLLAHHILDSMKQRE